ncbi:RNA polymerase ECF-subfamily sigma factor [Streptomyces sp. e14]|nr:RNA polymerase ECF-subfamily sigma factor [Streptomyces sp. e14]
MDEALLRRLTPGVLAALVRRGSRLRGGPRTRCRTPCWKPSASGRPIRRGTRRAG